MTNLPKINLAIWRSGDWLSDALEIYAPIRLKKAKPDVPSNPSWLNNLDITEENKAQFRQIGSSFNAAAGVLSRNAERHLKQAELVLCQFINGELIAFGFQPQKLSDAGPEEVPIHLFNAEFVKWQRNEIKSPYLHFVQVRVLNSQKMGVLGEGVEPPISAPLEPAHSSSSQANIQKNKPGPKPVGNEIRRIYALLKGDGAIPKKHSVKNAWKAFVIYVENNPSDVFKDGRGMAYSTFAREIAIKSDI